MTWNVPTETRCHYTTQTQHNPTLLYCEPFLKGTKEMRDAMVIHDKTCHAHHHV